MTSGTMVSRIPGFIHSTTLLTVIGAAGGGMSTAFQTASILPSTVLNLLASGVFDAVLVPQIISTLKRKHGGGTYANRLFTLAGTLLFIVTILSMVTTPLLVVVTATSYGSEIRALTILFVLLCLSQLLFYGLYNLLGGLLNTRRVFNPHIWASIASSLAGIAGLGAFFAIWGSSENRIEVADFTSAQFWLLGGSATLDMIAQALTLFVLMKRAGIRFMPDFRFRGTRFSSTSKAAGWTFATLGVSQVGVLSTSNLVAPTGACTETHDGVFAGISACVTTFMIFMPPRSLITVSLVTAISTRMIEAVVDDDDRGVAIQCTMSIRTITSLTLLAATVLIAGSVSMTQMVLPSYSNQEIITGYAQIPVALMPGVVSTGMVLMGQRVSFTYESVKPAFLMGIGPTIIRAIVSWDMYSMMGATWRIIDAILGGTACRLVQGVIAMIWVSKRNAFVGKASLLRSYPSLLTSASITGLLAFGILWTAGVHTIMEPTSTRINIATGKMLLATLIASFGYLIAPRSIALGKSARTIAPLLARFKIPNGVRILLAALLQMSPRKAKDDG